MRPRVFPAEDARDDARARMLAAASMRPRVFPAEDASVPGGVHARASASMRPRVFPAEDAPAMAQTSRPTERFNEAAGIPRGRLVSAISAQVSGPPLQ